MKPTSTALALLLCFFTISIGGEATTRDRDALLSFKAGVVLDPNETLSDWVPTSDVCNWTRVTCHPIKRRVWQLDLSSSSLHGTVSPSLSNLSFLTVLDLSSNSFHGRIPRELGELSRLSQLSLSSNLFEGRIPDELGYLRRLIYLDLGNNRLSGRIPGRFLHNLTAVQYVDLTNNSLEGEIPLGNRSKLPDLRFLLLWSNRLSGPIPPSLSNSTEIQWIDVESNCLSGELPTAMVSHMPRLQYLFLSYNNFVSHDNNTNIRPFFAALANCTHLQELELAGNNLAGEIPSEVGDLSENLTQLHLDDNGFYGSIPPTFSNLINLTFLNLSYNLLNGSIPPQISLMKKLGLLDLSNNHLSGTIPHSLSNLTQLRRLLLHHNSLYGVIPSSLGECSNLEILDLSYNRLEGRIPNPVAGLSSLKLYLNLSNNALQGPLPLELSKMDMVLAIDLSSNNLSGMIPPQLGGCVAIEYLNLSGNALHGPLPASIGKLSYLQTLDLSLNHLVGTIPDSLRESSMLSFLNLSFNNFSGDIQSFSSLTVGSFLGNPNLCGSSFPGLSPCRGKRNRRSSAVRLSVILTCCIGVPVLLLCLFGYPLLMKWRGIRPSTLKDEEEVVKLPRLSYMELMEATGGFGGSSLIGSGRFGQVYKGTLKDDTMIAVKVLMMAPPESFKRECEVLKRTRHRNLIRIITACSRPDFKLDLVQVVGIVSDVAEGMAYLHHYSPVRVIHCDLKPSNVLLDEDMTAIIADFGIARLVLHGSVGYIAPEYGLVRHPSTQGDVYSFGVLILETVTGKRPTDTIFQEGSTLQEWVKGHYPDDLEAIIDDALLRMSPSISHCDEVWRDVTVELIELGVTCTQYTPSLRPSMIEVAHEIGALRRDLKQFVSKLMPADTFVRSSSSLSDSW
ncbi:putative leucine-rich repeat receptor-like serine/threonine-protein kinase [Acorus gramineus]|uniref:non-specific serine/threonine protein kinase n=1 Tax=Acorus gramineus TaxID=55184 RepID=A0AAV9BEB6_ACOGR|nr:putative leucine-rich repeat receptor-like serine/threonine-protein kinase [Acorus gramineus]